MNHDTARQPCDEWNQRLAERVAQVRQQVARLRAEREAQTPAASALFAEFTRSAPLLTLGSGSAGWAGLACWSAVTSVGNPDDAGREP
jgi:hypothetical protein